MTVTSGMLITLEIAVASCVLFKYLYLWRLLLSFRPLIFLVDFYYIKNVLFNILITTRTHDILSQITLLILLDG